MSDQSSRPPVRVRLRYNLLTGAVEEFLVDDFAADRSEQYHDRVAQVVASQLVRDPRVVDAGARLSASPGHAASEDESAETDRRRDLERR
ncbi:hypothetical protein M2352_003371 [Azospirillum fermentarium]|uniref:hypothetical protein n=1 Tax=Azospirillum fermentarium TaxID=1233114 RepID=UPI0022262808|nr:hypothetical protein [Azospirillum fermentarium]MCW2247737.1 hypothetical protein [Azospirillum fermentarium]